LDEIKAPVSERSEMADEHTKPLVLGLSRQFEAEQPEK
jgi:hypothetical protein